ETADGVRDLGDAPRSTRAADVNRRADVLEADFRRLGDQRDGGRVARPGNGAAGDRTIRDPLQLRTPPRAARPVGVDDVEAGRLGFDDGTHLAQRIRFTGRGEDGEACAVGR